MTDTKTITARPNVLKNIFTLTDRGSLRGPEDRFTAAWGYLLDREPSVAQAVAEILVKGLGINTKVVKANEIR